MNLKKLYLDNIVKYDFITKFNEKKKSFTPKITKVILEFKFKNSLNTDVISSLLALELITNQKPVILLSKIDKNLNLRIKAGSPIGCTVTLRKDSMNNFLFYLFFVKLPYSSSIKNIIITDIKQKNITFNLKDLSIFDFIEDNYYLFKNLKGLTVSLITNSKNSVVTSFLMSSLKVPARNII